MRLPNVLFAAPIVVLVAGLTALAAQPAGSTPDRREVEHFKYGSVGIEPEEGVP